MFRWVKQKTLFHHCKNLKQKKQDDKIFHLCTSSARYSAFVVSFYPIFWDISCYAAPSAVKNSFTLEKDQTQNYVPLIWKKLPIHLLGSKKVREKFRKIGFILEKHLPAWRRLNYQCNCLVLDSLSSHWNCNLSVWTVGYPQTKNSFC